MSLPYPAPEHVATGKRCQYALPGMYYNCRKVGHYILEDKRYCAPHYDARWRALNPVYGQQHARCGYVKQREGLVQSPCKGNADMITLREANGVNPSLLPMRPASDGEPEDPRSQADVQPADPAGRVAVEREPEEKAAHIRPQGNSRRVLLLHLDGRLPNLALMRIAAHHKALGDTVELRRGNPEPVLWSDEPDLVYGSAIFESTRPIVERALTIYPRCVMGGTGHSLTETLEAHGITTLEKDYGIYPEFRQSLGFTQRGCRLSCEFCVVPRKEGRVKPEQSVWEIWRGDPWPREIVLLDNDFFGQPRWKDRITEMREGRFKVSLTQGINARCITDEAAEAIASIDYRNDRMNTKRIYTAWDNRPDEERLFAGLNRLVKYGVKPDHIMVYMLVGYWPGETAEDREYRRKRLRDFGARPYPMPFHKTQELMGFQRFCMGAYDKPRKDRPAITWAEFQAANYRPEKLVYA